MPANRRQFIEAGAGALAGMSLWGCEGESQSTTGAAQTADTVLFRNGVVLPVDAGFSQHAALAIRGNEIVAVGSNEEMMAAAGANPVVVELNGRTILPGFIEPHMHFALMAGLGHLRDVGPFEIPNFDDVLDALSDIRAGTAAEEWVSARQYDPTTAELDRVVPDRPAFVLNASGHIAYVNSVTLELVGISRDTPDPDGAEYGRFEDGTPNGILYGANAILPVFQQYTQIAERLQTGFVDAGREVGKQAAAQGITTLCDQAMGRFLGATGNRQLPSHVRR